MPVAIRLYQQWPEAAAALSALRRAGFEPGDIRLLGRLDARLSSSLARARALGLAALTGLCLGASLGGLLISTGWQPESAATAQALNISLWAGAIGLFALLARVSYHSIQVRRRRRAMRGSTSFAMLVSTPSERQAEAWKILGQAAASPEVPAQPRADHKWGGLMVYDSQVAAKEGMRTLRRRGFKEEVNHRALFAT